MTHNQSSRSPLWIWFCLAFIVMLLDQYTKMLIIETYQLGDATRVTAFFNIVRVHNTGAAFSFLSNASGWQRWFFTSFSIIAVGVIVWLLRTRGSQRLFATALSFILGGAIGNVIDRLWHGYVVDFLDFHAAGMHFPAFNVADSAITLGAACLILDELLRARRAKT